MVGWRNPSKAAKRRVAAALEAATSPESLCRLLETVADGTAPALDVAVEPARARLPLTRSDLSVFNLSPDSAARWVRKGTGKWWGAKMYWKKKTVES